MNGLATPAAHTVTDFCACTLFHSPADAGVAAHGTVQWCVGARGVLSLGAPGDLATWLF